MNVRSLFRRHENRHGKRGNDVLFVRRKGARLRRSRARRSERRGRSAAFEYAVLLSKVGVLRHDSVPRNSFVAFTRCSSRFGAYLARVSCRLLSTAASWKKVGDFSRLCMTPRIERSSRLRQATLCRAEMTLTRLRNWTTLSRFFCLWREPTWRSRRTLQKALNVVRYRQAVASARRVLLCAGFDAWASLRPAPPPGPQPPPGLQAPPGLQRIPPEPKSKKIDLPPPRYQ